MTLTQKDCVYCQEFEQGYFIWQGKNYGSRIILETENFVVFPSLGPLVEGHVLIASKEHKIGMSQLPKQHYKELERVLEEVRDKIAATYTYPVVFEHGDISEGKRAGSCIQHAHFHVVPVQVPILSYLMKRFSGDVISRLEELSTQAAKSEPYLFVEEVRRYVFHVRNVLPSQYLRQVIAIQLGNAQVWNWRSNPNLETMLQTKERLQCQTHTK